MLGATGSVGASALEVIRMHPDRFKAVGLSAWQQTDALMALVCEFSPAIAAAAPEVLSSQLVRAGKFPDTTRYCSGTAGLKETAAHPDAATVVAGISGAAGLESIFAAAHAGKRILIANKEPLVMCGNLLRRVARESRARLFPVDSEHNAIFQCLPEGLQREVIAGRGLTENAIEPAVTHVTLTASGGPFLRTAAADLNTVSIDAALEHPTWKMGPKISVDSATLMNKGLELIEACMLFGLDESQVEVVIHPQSALHSVVYFEDGSLIGQMANPDMRIPIAYGLSYPDRIPSGVPPLDLVAMGRLEFEAPDIERFPCIGLARAVIRQGGSAPIVLNAANEVAVEAFLAGMIRFSDIPSLIDAVLNTYENASATELSVVLSIDQEARAAARNILAKGLYRIGV
ncbi:MAG TPA: 1-deoxy-D-xylulose-5-phosphate reductoisomerase [Gammaproteobacteria bacterium]|nr:1-deoxy-D-xylulose-5-phosphate reductoisomerase [Gammaproteobacteria bacterium]